MIDSKTISLIMTILALAVSIITIIIVSGVVVIAILKDGSTTTSVVAAFTAVIGFMVSTAGFIIHTFMSNNSPSQITVPPSQIQTNFQVKSNGSDTGGTSS